MDAQPGPIDRRQFLRLGAGTVAALAFPNRLGASPYPADLITRAIPSSGERIPAIGMGTYITFNVGGSKRLRQDRAKVLQTFFDLGGGMIDSSPMYGSSEEVIGYCLNETTKTERMFSATKIWTPSGATGREQMNDSLDLWGVRSFDLQQVHNLVNWRSHLDHMRSLKEKGRIRYLGITTSHGRRHDELESVLKNEPLDFVQLTYNIENRRTEDRLIPLAAERGIAVIANRPYAGGRLMDRYQGEPLPDWAPEAGMANWAEFFLKFVIARPGITCAIPATSQVAHMRENMGAMRGKLPGEATRKRMADYVARL